ncbi:MAG TPA: hypothetical protein VMT03_18930 [Polyangia bacterium]|nr:hypothetical protein [Polyangia bacterium]
MSSGSGRFIDVEVEEHDELPEGCELRFHAVGESRPVSRVQYEPLTGPEGTFVVIAAGGGHAQATPVDDSSAGTSVLITGDERGLRLQRVDAQDEPPVAEPYLLLAADAILD